MQTNLEKVVILYGATAEEKGEELEFKIIETYISNGDTWYIGLTENEPVCRLYHFKPGKILKVVSYNDPRKREESIENLTSFARNLLGQEGEEDTDDEIFI